MPKDVTIQSILIIGSGPIIIGQAAEFDYSGTQACLALKEEGYRIILVNNNPATIMTDEVHADAVYFEPLTVESVEKIIAKERPDGLLATFGGQTGLNLAFQLHEKGILEKYGVKLLGTPIEAIKKGEDREAFRQLMYELGEPVPESEIITNVEEAVAFAERVGFPIIIRPAYTLGGSGGGIAQSMEQYVSIVKKGLAESPITQCLVERSVAGYKEIEYEVMRDASNTCITVCNMENVDPVGVHTGDSIVVAPSQTLTDEEYHMLRSSAVKIISALGIIGGCNIQFALDPFSKNYYLIEVNPRVSRSSALASKATGYPIARIAAKLAVGYTLGELLNPVTKNTYASFEPALDYVVVKFPRLPFDKFPYADRQLGTQMKATGEVMSIDRNMERAFQKAVHSLEGENEGLILPSLQHQSTEELKQLITKGDDRRFFAILELFRRGESIETVYHLTKIDRFFLNSFYQLVTLEGVAKQTSYENIKPETLQLLKEKGFSDAFLAEIWGVDELEVRKKRKEFGIIPSYKMVDTCAAEFHSDTDYYYSSYFGESELKESDKPKMLIIGSGPICIGQGIEFDYSSVHCVYALQQQGYETVMVNNNPETVSTDFAIADRLYFEPLALEDVLNVIEAEQIDKVIVQFGGQTAINLVEGLENAGVTIVGVSHDIIDQLEDRDRFYQLLEELNIPHVPGVIADGEKELFEKTAEIGYPILLRPSYVIGGKGMFIIKDEAELNSLLEGPSTITYPMLIDAYLQGKEVEVDLVADGENILIPTVVEHVEKAGVHSGDSYAFLPAISLTESEKEQIVASARKIVKKLHFKGIMNIQYVIHNGVVYVLEVNPRASRTVPIVSKTTGVPMTQIATNLLLGKSLREVFDAKAELLQDVPYVVLKYPVFSTHKLPGVDSLVGPEMKSTGEGISIAKTVEEAVSKTFHQYMLGRNGANEIYIDTDDQFIRNSITNKVGNTNLIIAKDTPFEDWVKREEALIFVSLKKDEQSSAWRKLALSQQILTFTELETFMLFLRGINCNDYSVMSIQEWINEKKHGEKAVIS